MARPYKYDILIKNRIAPDCPFHPLVNFKCKSPSFKKTLKFTADDSCIEKIPLNNAPPITYIVITPSDGKTKERSIECPEDREYPNLSFRYVTFDDCWVLAIKYTENVGIIDGVPQTPVTVTGPQ